MEAAWDPAPVFHCCMIAVASAAGSKLTRRPSAVTRGGKRMPGTLWPAAAGAAGAAAGEADADAAGCGAAAGVAGAGCCGDGLPPTSLACMKDTGTWSAHKQSAGDCVAGCGVLVASTHYMTPLRRATLHCAQSRREQQARAAQLVMLID